MKNNYTSEIIRTYVSASKKIEDDLEAQRDFRIQQIEEKWKKVEKPDAKKGDGDFAKKTQKIQSLDAHKVAFDNFLLKVKIEKNNTESGIDEGEAKERNRVQGDNMLSERKTSPWYVKLFHEFTSQFALMLWAGSALCFLSFGLDTNDKSNLFLGVVQAFVISLTGVVTFFQNAKSDSIMASFKNFIPPKCTVIRGGREDQILAQKVVVGDLIKINDGDRIPADVRIIECKEMRVDNSSQTGESDPLIRSDKQDTENQNILNAKNVAFFGTLCKSGEGKGIAFGIGDDTVIGQIAGLADTAEAGETPLRQELDRFIKMITVIALTLGVFFFVAGFFLKYTAIQNMVFAIGIIVANVPEGLLATITITQSVASRTLATKKVLVKNQESVETLGSTSCICSDKTGTLTQNKMTIENLFYNLKIVKGDNYERFGEKHAYAYDRKTRMFQSLHEAAIVNTVATFSDTAPERIQALMDNVGKNDPNREEKLAKIEESWQEELATMPYYDRPVNGDASETAIVKFFQGIEDIKETRSKYPLTKNADGSDAQVKFNSKHKFSLKVCEITKKDPSLKDQPNFKAFLKGAPERVWDQCSYILVDNKVEVLDKKMKETLEQANSTFARLGQRVLGFASMELNPNAFPPGHKFNVEGAYDTGLPTNNFCFVGLMSIIDPPRDSVPGAIEKCKTAGIKVIMVTGDQQLTASAIAANIGIIEGESSIDLMERKGIPYEMAVDEADAIVVNGDMLREAYLEDEGLPENEKGKKLEKWLQKPQIVFARTSPVQKHYIVKGCQKLGYTVAVTGDGVNDSPAIKQADIGLAMGITGSEVAKDSADMILLNDDFGSIIVGIEEGRKIFDNLKKSIAYTLTSNIPEILPFIAFILMRIPLPLSTVLILCVDLGTDIFPAVSFAFEDSELDIMTRTPRRKFDHLVSRKLLTFSYLQMGIIQTCGGFMCYYVVMADFGFAGSGLNGLVQQPYLVHNPSDTYDPTAKYYGNTNVMVDCTNPEDPYLGVINDYGFTRQSVGNMYGVVLDWLFTNHMYQDTRMGFIDADCENTTNFVKSAIKFVDCQVHQISPITERPVCYTTEALKYAQTSFFFSICATQFSNTLSCKTRKLSLAYQGLRNYFMIFGWCTETCLTIFLAYLLPINHVFGTRDLLFIHFALPSLPFSMLMLVYDEARKYCIRNWDGIQCKPTTGEDLWKSKNLTYCSTVCSGGGFGSRDLEKENTNWFERNTLW